MKSALTKMFVVVAGLIACLQWGQISYRLALFYYQCNAERGINHVEDGTFWFAYSVDAALLLIGIFVIHLHWKNPGFWRTCSMAFVLANLAGGITLFNMHRTGVLVGYGEAMQKARKNYHPEPSEDESAWLDYKQAEAVASNFLSNCGYTTLHCRGKFEDGRFPRYQFSTNSSVLEIKVIVDRKNGKVGYDYSHW